VGFDDRNRCEASSRRCRRSCDRAEGDVADDHVADLCNERHAQAARGSKQVDQPRLHRRGKAGGVHGVDVYRIPGLLRPNQRREFLPRWRGQAHPRRMAQSFE
jgi:hypothetical protein